MHGLLRKFVEIWQATKRASAFDPKQDTWQRKKVKIFVLVCATVLPFYSAALIPTGLFKTERLC
jgi:hypothetical protein